MLCALRSAAISARSGLQKLREQRLEDLRASGELLRRAGEIRALVAQVRAAVARGEGLAVTGEQLARWERWALAEAHRLDPVMSEQVLTHLVVPALDGDEPGGPEPDFT